MLQRVKALTEKPTRFYIESPRKGIFAECDVYSGNQIVVLAGSTATKQDSSGLDSTYRKLKERLIADGVSG